MSSTAAALTTTGTRRRLSHETHGAEAAATAPTPPAPPRRFGHDTHGAEAAATIAPNSTGARKPPTCLSATTATSAAAAAIGARYAGRLRPVRLERHPRRVGLRRRA